MRPGVDRSDDRLIAAIRAKVMDPSLDGGGGTRPSLDVCPPATPEMIEATEVSLRGALHPFLKRVYLEIANGGFGPGYGLLRLTSADEVSTASSLVATYRDFSSTEWPEHPAWPKQLIPLWDWGDAAWSCLDNATVEGAIVTHDDVAGPTETVFTLRSWLESWARGVDLWKEIYEDREATIISPFTKEPFPTKVRGFAKGKVWSPSK